MRLKNKPLTEEQKKHNKTKSKTRVRVEHVFGFMEYNMNKLNILTIGIRRAEQFVNMVNLTYNLDGLRFGVNQDQAYLHKDDSDLEILVEVGLPDASFHGDLGCIPISFDL